MITQLNGEAFVRIIKTLDFGLSQVTFPPVRCLWFMILYTISC